MLPEMTEKTPRIFDVLQDFKRNHNIELVR